MSKAVEAEVEKFKRGMLDARLSRCSQKQRDFFKRIYPKGVPEKSLVSAIDLCDRTLRKNKVDPVRTAEESGTRKFFKTVVTYEVLSEKQIGEVTLAELGAMCDDGDCVGRWGREEQYALTKKQAADALYEFGSEPGFFGLDDEGEEVG